MSTTTDSQASTSRETSRWATADSSTTQRKLLLERDRNDRRRSGNFRIGDNGFRVQQCRGFVHRGRRRFRDRADGGFVNNGQFDSDSTPPLTVFVGGSFSLGVSGGNNTYVSNNGTSTIHIAGDFTLEGDGSYVTNGRSATTKATFQVDGSFVLPGASDYVYNYGNGNFAVGSLQLGVNGEFYNHGALSVSGSATTLSSAIRIYAGGSLDVASGADFTVDAGGAILGDSGSTVTVEGDLTVESGAFVLTDLFNVSDAAIVEIFGTLDVSTEVIEGHAQVNQKGSGEVSSGLSIHLTPYSGIYDGVAHSASGTATGALGEDLSGLLDFTATTHTNAGSYAGDAWTFLGNSGYAGMSGSIDDEIAKADQTITVTQAAPTSAIYGTSFLVSATASSGLAVGIAASWRRAPAAAPDRRRLR